MVASTPTNRSTALAASATPALAFCGFYVARADAALFNKASQVVLARDGDRTVINGRRGRIEAPPTIVSNHPWNHEVIERTLLFDTQRGRLQEVAVTPAGRETVTIAGRKVEAQKYRITGDLERELWYDDAGNWLQSRLEHDGAQITLTRRS